MNVLRGMTWGVAVAAGALICCGLAAAADATSVPVPQSTPLPMTPNTDHGPYYYYPTMTFLKESRALVPVDLAKAGYTEDEFVVSGKANVYDWASDGALTVRTPDAPYGTRILVRHPSDPAKFSGTVVVEIMNAARRFDWSMMWGYLAPEIMERGDAWVGVTMPGGVYGLRKFDNVRYSGVSFKNPAPGACPTANPDTEDGLKFDMLSQVAALLKSDAPNKPLAGFKVEDLYLTTQGGDAITYAAAIEPHAKLADGKPVYDGFLIKTPGGPGRINQCATPPAKSDPRYVLHNVGAPVIMVASQSEVINGLAARRPDSDEANDRFRLYEIAGAMHLDVNAYDPFPNLIDQALAGNAQGTPSWPFNARCTPEIPLNDNPLLSYEFHAALANLDRWVRKGTAPPRAPRIQVKDADGPSPSVVLDQYGNGVGGIRTFYVDIPVATYFMSSPGPGVCAEFGHTAAFDWGRLDSLYGSYKSYASKVSQSVERSLKERWLTEADARRIKAELKVKTAPPVVSSGR